MGWEDPLEKGMATHSCILSGEIRGKRILVGYSLWGCKEPNTIEQLMLTLSTFGLSMVSLRAVRALVGLSFSTLMFYKEHKTGLEAHWKSVFCHLGPSWF